MQTAYPTEPKDRFHVYRFFNGLAEEGREGLDHRRSRVPLVKSFLLEHVSSGSGRTPRPPQAILQALGVDSVPLDETFMEVRAMDIGTDAGGSDRRTVGYVEQFSERFFAYYTSDDSQSATKRVNHWITRSPDLDSAWFSSPLLQRLWDSDVSQRGGRMAVLLRFLSLFERKSKWMRAVVVTDLRVLCLPWRPFRGRRWGWAA